MRGRERKEEEVHRLLEAQEHIHYMQLTRPSPKGSPDQRAGEICLIFWWEELHSHRAKGVDTGRGGVQGHFFSHQISSDHTRGLPGLDLGTSSFPSSSLPFHLLPWLAFFPHPAQTRGSFAEATSHSYLYYSPLFPMPSCTWHNTWPIVRIQCTFFI